MEDIILTNHGKKRGKERIGLSRAAMERLSKIAFEKGVKVEEIKEGRVAKYLKRVQSNNYKANNIRLYSMYLFIFAKDTLLTVFALPLEFRNYKKYIKAHTPDDNT